MCWLAFLWVLSSALLVTGRARAEPPTSLAPSEQAGPSKKEQLLAGKAEAAREQARDERTPSKKARFLAGKARHPVRARRAPRAPALHVLTLRNQWTRELLPVDPQHPPAPAVVDRFLRCHYTNQATDMDPRLLDVALRAARHFKATFIQVVSGYRAPKYNLMLRKKGHAVARESQHPLGHALDFRLPGTATRKLYRFVRGLRLGGVGYYPESAFVHADVGPVRTWRGQ